MPVEYNILDNAIRCDYMKEIEDSKYLYNDIEDPFLKQRMMTLLNWNIRKATIYKRSYYTFSILSMISPIAITILNSMDGMAILKDNVRIISVLLTTVATISSALTVLYRYKEKWKEHRKLVEKLKAEIVKMHIKNQKQDEELKILSRNIEELVLESNTQIMKLVDSEGKDGK